MLSNRRCFDCLTFPESIQCLCHCIQVIPINIIGVVTISLAPFLSSGHSNTMFHNFFHSISDNNFQPTHTANIISHINRVCVCIFFLSRFYGRHTNRNIIYCNVPYFNSSHFLLFHFFHFDSVCVCVCAAQLYLCRATKAHQSSKYRL